VVTEREARQWARDRGFEYWETSAKTGNGIAKAIETLVNGCSATPQAPTMNTAASGTRVPSTPRGSGVGGSGNAVDGTTGSSSGADGSNDNRPLEEWSVKELRNELRNLGISHDDCLEKKDFIDRLAIARSEHAASDAQERKHRDGERQRERIMAEVDAWSRFDLRAMINDLLSSSASSPDYLSPASTFAMISKAYKRALLVVHPVRRFHMYHDRHWNDHLPVTASRLYTNGC
jgi:hypothetical protein